jgi:hypothetical protein
MPPHRSGEREGSGWLQKSMLRGNAAEKTYSWQLAANTLVNSGQKDTDQAYSVALNIAQKSEQARIALS